MYRRSTVVDLSSARKPGSMSTVCPSPRAARRRNGPDTSSVASSTAARPGSDQRSLHEGAPALVTLDTSVTCACLAPMTDRLVRQFLPISSPQWRTVRHLALADLRIFPAAFFADPRPADLNPAYRSAHRPFEHVRDRRRRPGSQTLFRPFAASVGLTTPVGQSEVATAARSWLVEAFDLIGDRAACRRRCVAQGGNGTQLGAIAARTARSFWTPRTKTAASGHVSGSARKPMENSPS